jgi:CheY-like chemotaxis protein
MASAAVLFVDDELDILADHVRKLEDAGLLVTQRRTTDEAVSEFVNDRGRNYDLVILDMMIPAPEGEPYHSLYDAWDSMRSGGQLLEILRQHTTEPRPPVLLLSNLRDDEMLTEAWDRYEMWCANHDRPVASASNHQMMAQALRAHFGTWVREKRRTPPWHLPVVVKEILVESGKPL